MAPLEEFPKPSKSGGYGSQDPEKIISGMAVVKPSCSTHPPPVFIPTLGRNPCQAATSTASRPRRLCIPVSQGKGLACFCTDQAQKQEVAGLNSKALPPPPPQDYLLSASDPSPQAIVWRPLIKMNSRLHR